MNEELRVEAAFEDAVDATAIGRGHLRNGHLLSLERVYLQQKAV